MTNNDMVTLNIYNHPPQLDDDSSGNINQTDFNLNTDKPQINQNYYYDNTRNGNPKNYNSAPRTKYPKKKQIKSSIDESSSSTDNNPNNTPVMAPPVQYPQFQQPIYQQVPVQPVQPIRAGQPIPMAPMANQMISPYNTPYGQPVVVQQRVNKNRNKPVNNAPQTIIIREREPKRKNTSGEDCCAGCLGANCCLS